MLFPRQSKALDPFVFISHGDRPWHPFLVLRIGNEWVPSRQQESPSLYNHNLVYLESESNPGLWLPLLPHLNWVVLCCVVSASPCPRWAQRRSPWAWAGFGTVRLCFSQYYQIRDAQHGPAVPFIWPYYVSSALLMVLICSHLLIFILLMHSLYSFISEVHLSWRFSLPLLSAVQCFLLLF